MGNSTEKRIRNESKDEVNYQGFLGEIEGTPSTCTLEEEKHHKKPKFEEIQKEESRMKEIMSKLLESKSTQDNDALISSLKHELKTLIDDLEKEAQEDKKKLDLLTKEYEKMKLEKLDIEEQLKIAKEELERRVDKRMKEIVEEIELIIKELDKEMTKVELLDISLRLKNLSSQWIIRNEIVEKESIDLRKKLNSHVSTTDHYNHSMLSNRYKLVKQGFSDKLFRLIIKKKKELKLKKDNRTLLKEFIKVMFDVLDSFINDYVNIIESEKLKNELDIDIQGYKHWVEYGLIEFGKNKERFIEKMKENYEEIENLFEDKILRTNLMEILDISLKMRIATPAGRFDFSDVGKEFNEDRNEIFNQNMQTEGLILYVLMPTYIVKDGLSDEDRVFQRSIVFTNEKKDDE